MIDRLAVRGGAPLLDRPFPAWPPVTGTSGAALERAFRAGVWSDVAGAEKLRFEEAFARMHDSRHALAVANGTVSLQIALAALGIGSGDEVIVPAYTFLATATSVLAVAATPVFVDILASTATIDVEAVEAAITPRTKAVIPVHFAGQPADLDALRALCDRTGIRLIEDAAQAHGARWGDRVVGAFGAFGSFSFQASKNMTAGEGGALTTDDDELADIAWSLHHCGRVRGEPWYNHERNGGNHRMTEFQAAILLDQIDAAEDLMAARSRAAAALDHALAGAGLEPLAVDPRVTRHAYHVYCLRYDPRAFGGLDRETFVAAMRAEGVPTSTGYISSLNRQPVFADHRFDVAALGLDASDPRIAYAQQRFTESDALCAQMVMFPQNLLLADDEQLAAIPEAVEKIRRNLAELR